MVERTKDTPLTFLSQENHSGGWTRQPSHQGALCTSLWCRIPYCNSSENKQLQAANRHTVPGCASIPRFHLLMAGVPLLCQCLDIDLLGGIGGQSARPCVLCCVTCLDIDSLGGIGCWSVRLCILCHVTCLDINLLGGIGGRSAWLSVLCCVICRRHCNRSVYSNALRPICIPDAQRCMCGCNWLSVLSVKAPQYALVH